MKTLLFLGLSFLFIGISMIYIVGGAGMVETGSIFCLLSIILIIASLLKKICKGKKKR